MSTKNIRLVFFTGFVFIILAFNQRGEENSKDKNINESKNLGLFHIPYFSSGSINNPVIILVLHGDSPFNDPSYQYSIAKQIADNNDNVVSVGILRPGYKDKEGNRSKGKRGKTTGDNYTKEVLKAIHDLTTELEEKYNPSKIILVGHSGGAAISANLVSEYPDVYSGALLIACPCDLHAWRAHMKTLQPKVRIWDKEVNSLSPIEKIKNINDSIQIIVIHGDNDEIVPISIANKYVKELKADNNKADFIVLENQGHEIAFDKKVFEIIKDLIH